MNFYEHTLITRQDTSPSQIKQLQEKYTKIIAEQGEKWSALKSLSESSPFLSAKAAKARQSNEKQASANKRKQKQAIEPAKV